MDIKVKRDSGYVRVNLLEVEQFVREQLLMVPGIQVVGSPSLMMRLKSLLKENISKGVKVNLVKDSTVIIECQITIAHAMNFSQIATQAQHVIKYSIEKHYGLDVQDVDIFIEGIN